MVRTIILCTAILISCGSVPAQEKPVKIAIIKADDMRRRTDKWERFFAVSRDKQVKVSVGIVCNSLQGDSPAYFAWLRELQASGHVEFWNHGWDHKRWQTDAGKKFREFRGSGYQHQKKHFEDAQMRMKAVLSAAPVAFGAPYNSIDADTRRVLAENDDMRVLFCYRSKGLKNKIPAPMALRGEADGTGKPNVRAFKEQYRRKQDLSFSAIQFHPNGFSDRHFGEYAKILDFLIAEGWTFVLPAEYLAMKEDVKEK